MNKKEFTKVIAKKVEELLGEDISVTVGENKKENGVILDSITVSDAKRSNMSPCIYVDSYYEAYEGGDDIDEIAERIAEVYAKSALDVDFDVESIMDFDKVRSRISGRLINTKRNEDLLDEIPYRSFHNLSLIYVVDVEYAGDSVGNVRVTNQHMNDIWHISESELYGAFMQNLITGEYRISNIAEMIKQMMGIEEEDEAVPECSMYVLSNKSSVYGAVELLNPAALSEAAEVLGKNYFILPSSVHEVILVPDDAVGEEKIAMLEDMVRSVNETEVSARDFLANSVYYYNRESREVTVAA